jgi:serine/threonine protein kinase
VTQGTENRDERIGAVVLDRYELQGLVGKGGQGAVYRALDRRTGHVVAVKVLHESVEQDPTSRERFTREAQALRALDGTAALHLIDFGFSGDGLICIVMELLVGNDLEDELTGMEKAGKVFRVADIPFLFGPIVTTLEKAHGLGIVHRDLKPQNVFIEHHQGMMRVRLIDFGFAKFQNLTRLTMDGFVAGSPSYIAPETWAQKPVAPSVDVYALGAMIYRTVAGQPPFASKSMVELLKLVTSGPRPSLRAARPDLSPAVDDWVRLALAADPKERYASPTASYRGFASAVGIRID